MTVRNIPWGATVLFSTTFADEEGNAITPTTARIRVRQGRTAVSADLTEESGGVFEYRLDTSVFPKPGLIFWAIDAAGDGDTKVAEDGQILLTANEARQAAA